MAERNLVFLEFDRFQCNSKRGVRYGFKDILFGSAGRNRNTTGDPTPGRKSSFAFALWSPSSLKFAQTANPISSSTLLPPPIAASVASSSSVGPCCPLIACPYSMHQAKISDAFTKI
ncbi:hypothetical protein CUMW_100140 [Citrus unshiu]|nr:hypothetical protein CUMW_100140 [Citrus unshiu]